MFGISKEKMLDLFKKYIVLKNNNVDVKLNDLTCDTSINKYIITIFDNIYKKFDFCERLGQGLLTIFYFF